MRVTRVLQYKRIFKDMSKQDERFMIKESVIIQAEKVYHIKAVATVLPIAFQ
jgi:hypothetical protein